MSQAAKQLIAIILGVLLFAAVGVAVIVSLQNKKLSGEKVQLLKQLDESRALVSSQTVELNDWKGKYNTIEKEKNELVAKTTAAGGNAEELSMKISDLSRERDELKKRFDTLQKERDELVAKFDEKAKVSSANVAENAQMTIKDGQKTEQSGGEEVKPQSPDDEDYWAQILKAKAALQMDVEKTKEDLAKSALEISDLKKQNSDLQLEISKLSSDKEAIAREIKYGNDLAKNLSVELARAQGEKQFMSSRMAKIKEENDSLHQQLKDLTSTKVALEKSIVKLQGDKKQIEGKLVETEGVIQSRVDQIYQLKDSLEKDFRPAVKNPKTGEVELSPIIVNSTDKNATEIHAPAAGVKGNVVSVNGENNFVIVNLGEDSGVKIGDKLNVYRGAEYIASLEIIQTRKDICAADIKSKIMAIEVGDSVR